MVPEFETEDSTVLPAKNPQPRRSLRKPLNPYVASTQGDFCEERQFLRETIFPQIDAVCQKRGTYFCPTNIEWKPSHPHVAAGSGLSLALELVSRSSPFLICMIGERYGEYRPDGSPPLPKSVKDLPPDPDWLDLNYLVAASSGYTWLLGDAHQNCSMLELEVMQAAFLCDNDHCLFYFRQPEHLDDKFLNLSLHRREKKMAKYMVEDEESRLRVRDLKQRIIKKGLAVKYFKSLQDLGNSVLDDWIAVLDMLYPQLQDAFVNIGTEELVDWTAHQMFADTRRNVFLGSSQISGIMENLGDFALSCLEEHKREDRDLLDQYQTYSLTSFFRKNKKEDVRLKCVFVLTGDTGSGKSSLIANWLKLFQEDNPDIKVLTDFVGSTCTSTDITSFMRRCIWELRKHYLLKGFTKPVDVASYETVTYGETCEAFTAALSLGPCVLVLDGLDRLSGTLGQTVQQVKQLSWLPKPLPPQCRVILTCVQSDLVYKSLTARSDVHFVSSPMVDTLQRCSQYLQHHSGYTFSHVKHRHLLKVWECSPKLKTRPLFLSLLANEMKCYDVYTDLDSYVENLAEVVGIREYWSRCLHRWLQSYSWTTEQFANVTDSTSTTTEAFAMVGWVADALRLITVSRHGLSQSELLAVLKRIGYSGRAEVREFDWLLFKESLGDSLYEGPGGLLNFSHQHLTDCIEYTLLGCVRPGSGETTSLNPLVTDWQKDKAVFHVYLADFFSTHPSLQRRVEELPWHLLMARETSNLEKVLASPEVFLTLADEERLWPCHRQDLRVYWSLLRERGVTPGQTYLRMLASVGLNVDVEDQTKGLNESSVSTSFSSIEAFQSRSPPKIVTVPPSDKDDLNEEVLPIETPDSSFTTFMTESDRDVKTSKMKWFTNDQSLEVNLAASLQNQNKDIALGNDSTSGPLMVQQLAWSVAGFLTELGEMHTVERVLVALHNMLLSASPLSAEQQLLLSQVQEKLGGIYMLYGDRELGETLYRKSTRTLTDICDTESDMDTSTEFSRAVLNLKGVVLAHHGEMMLRDGFDEDAEEFFEEAQECQEVSGDIVGKAKVLFQLGVLKIQQEDFAVAEMNLRQSLTYREQWFGHSHPLVAETVFVLAHLMSLENNTVGYNRLLSETLYRRALSIREKCLGANHPLVATTLLHLGKLLQCNAGLSVKNEVIKLMRRALDIRTTIYGSKHPDTKEARRCVHEVEVSVQLGQYEFGPAKPVDKRTVERPFSGLSWRESELKDKHLRASSARRSPSQRPRQRSAASSGRPQSSLRSASYTHLHRQTSAVSQQSPSSPKKSEAKTFLKSVEGPNSRLVQCDVVPLHLEVAGKTFQKADGPKKPSSPSLESEHPVALSAVKGVKPLKLDIRMTPEEVNGSEVQTPDTVQDEDSDGNVKRSGKIVRPLSGPARLYQRYSNVSKQQRCRPASALEPRRRMYNTKSSLKTLSLSSFGGLSQRSCCNETQLFPMNTSDVYSLGGPKSSLSSLLQDARSPQDFQKETHHKSTWYHVPGRYVTPVEIVPRKRSQVRTHSASSLSRTKRNISRHFGSSDDDCKVTEDLKKLEYLGFDGGDSPVIPVSGRACTSPGPSHSGNVVTFTGAVVVG